MPGASSLLVLSGVSDTWIPSFTGLFRGRARTSQAIVSLHSLLLSCTHEQCTHRDGDLRASRLHLVADKSLHCLATALNARQPRLGGIGGLSLSCNSSSSSSLCFFFGFQSLD